MLAHLDELYAFYGEHAGVRVARKHLGWYRDTALGAVESPYLVTGAAQFAGPQIEESLFRQMRTAETAHSQAALTREWLESLEQQRTSGRVVGRLPTAAAINRNGTASRGMRGMEPVDV
jgi:hypothetical protein